MEAALTDALNWLETGGGDVVSFKKNIQFFFKGSGGLKKVRKLLLDNLAKVGGATVSKDKTQ